MGRKIAGVIMSILLLGAVGLLLKQIFIDFPQKQEKRFDLRSAYKDAYQLGVEAGQFKRQGKLYQAAEKYIAAADRLRSALRVKPREAKNPGIKKRMLDYYQHGIDLFLQDAQALPVEQAGRVTYIFDGDTVGLENGERVRYLGIDAPEHDTAWGPKASRANALLVEQKPVQLKYDKEKKDQYERTLAYVFRGNLFVNAELIKQGMARYYSPVGQNLRYKRLLLACEFLAKENKVGMWK